MASGDVLLQYPVTQSLTVTLTSLADGSARQSTVVDNRTTKYDDVLLSIKTKASGTASGVLEIWGYSSVEKATPVYTDGASGTDSAFTAANIKNCVYIGSVRLDGTNSVQWGAKYIAERFGGRMPPWWGVILKSSAGGAAALSATIGDHVVEWEGSFYNQVP